MMNAAADRARTIVVLIDEAVLCSHGGTRLDHNAFESLLEDVAALWADNYRCILVITGESTVGWIQCRKLAAVPRDRRRDVWGAVGRSFLDSWISSRMAERGLKVGSLHLTRSMFANRESYGAIRDTIRGLEANDMCPVIWDNGWSEKASSSDTADQLMSLIAGQAAAQMAVVGLAEDPKLVRGDLPLPTREITIDELDRNLKQGAVRALVPTRQRLESILAAARLLGAMGTSLMLTSLKEPTALTGSLRGERDHLILQGSADAPGVDGVRRWLSAGAIPQGTIVVSPYAATQLANEEDRSSLLAAGVVDTAGSYRENDVVSVEDEVGRLLGYGVAKYGGREVSELRGQRNVIVIHADQFFGVGLQDLAETPQTAAEESVAERS